MELLNKEELKEILIKGWMTHDAMWLLHCLRKTGIETTNKINKAASAGLGRIEAKRFKKILNIDEIRTPDDLKKFIQLIFHVVKAEFMKFSYKFIILSEAQMMEKLKYLEFSRGISCVISEIMMDNPLQL